MKIIIFFTLTMPLLSFGDFEQINQRAKEVVTKSQKTRKNLEKIIKQRDPASLKNNFKDFEKFMNDDTNWENDIKNIIEN